MPDQTPVFATGLFVLLVIMLAGALLGAVYLGSGRSKRAVGRFALVLLAWLAFIGALAVAGFFRDFTAMPPHIAVAVVPALVAVILLAFIPATGRIYANIPPEAVISLQSFRIIMEGILYLLFCAGLVPREITFEGRNFDILIGLSAPLVAYFCFARKTFPYRIALLWNVAGLLVLANVVVRALRAAPNFPGIAIGYFPFAWLPAFVVPVAVLLHLVSIRQVRNLI